MHNVVHRNRSLHDRTMSRSADEHRPTDPSVQPIDALIAQSSEEAERAALSGEEVDEWDLRYGEPCGAEGDVVEEVLGEEWGVDAE